VGFKPAAKTVTYRNGQLPAAGENSVMT
jgi:hypothetical protein